MTHDEFIAAIVEIGSNIGQDMSHREAVNLEARLLELIARLHAEGLRLVPIEPTDAMLDAAARASMQHLIDCINDPARADEIGNEATVRKTHGSRYRSMLAAAPK